MLWLLPGMLLCHMLVCMVMVMMDVELRQRSRVYVLVREMVLHYGEIHGVVEKVMVMELVVVMGPKRQERHRHEAWGRRHRKEVRPWYRIPRPARRWPHGGPPALRVLQLPEIILQTSE